MIVRGEFQIVCVFVAILPVIDAIDIADIVDVVMFENLCHMKYLFLVIGENIVYRNTSSISSNIVLNTQFLSCCLDYVNHFFRCFAF